MLRPYLALVLALLLGLTGLGLAVARGQPGPAGHLVICTGTGPVMIAVDKDGRPTGSAQYCPDAGQSLLQALFATVDIPSGAGQVKRLAPRPLTVHRAGLIKVAPQARGPPVRA